jgi:hypothetical protein
MEERLTRFKALVGWITATAICDYLNNNASHEWVKTSALWVGIPSALMTFRSVWLYVRAVRRNPERERRY